MLKIFQHSGSQFCPLAGGVAGVPGLLVAGRPLLVRGLPPAVVRGRTGTEVTGREAGTTGSPSSGSSPG